MEQYTGESSRFSVKPSRNVDILGNPCEFDTRFCRIWSSFTEKYTAQKFLSETSSFQWYKKPSY